MKKERFQRLLVEQHEELKRLTAGKGEEYARSDDQLANFKRQALELEVGPEKILAVYLNKHLDAIKTFLKTGTNLSEPIGGRIDDAILYLILLKALIIDRYEPKTLDDAYGNPAKDQDRITRTPWPAVGPGPWPPSGPFYTTGQGANAANPFGVVPEPETRVVPGLRNLDNPFNPHGDKP